MSSAWDAQPAGQPAPALLARFPASAPRVVGASRWHRNRHGRRRLGTRPVPSPKTAARRQQPTPVMRVAPEPPRLTLPQPAPRPSCYLCGAPVPVDDEYYSPKCTTAHLSCVRATRAQGDKAGRTGTGAVGPVS